MYGPTKWKLVPIEPTEEMIKAGIDTPCADTGDDSVDQPQDYRNVYSAMVNAAPVAERQEPIAYMRNEGTPNNLVKCTFTCPGAFGVYRSPVAVALPERKPITPGFLDATNHGWNACLDKVKELNQ